MYIAICIIVLFTGCCLAQNFPSAPTQGQGFTGQNSNGTFRSNIPYSNIGNINTNGLRNTNGFTGQNWSGTYPSNNSYSNIGNINGLTNTNGPGFTGQNWNGTNPSDIPNTNIGNTNGSTNTNDTSDENLERPCEVYDTYCIRQYFTNNANCNAAYGPVPEPYYRPQSTSYIPNANLTTTLNNIEIKGLNGRIEEFYINRMTDRLIITIEFRGLSLNSTSAYFRFHRRSREPIVTSDTFSIVYQSVISTIIIPNARNLQLDQSEVFSYVNDAPSILNMGSGISNSSVSEVTNSLTELTANIMISIREILLTDGAFYPATFIQWNICDFGLRVL